MLSQQYSSYITALSIPNQTVNPPSPFAPVKRFMASNKIPIRAALRGGEGDISPPPYIFHLPNFRPPPPDLKS